MRSNADTCRRRGGDIVKFIVTWRVHADKRVDVMTGFAKMTPADDDADTGPDVSIIGRWHNPGEGTGVAVCESDSADAVYRWTLNWAPALDLTVEPVLDDAEVRAVINDAYGG
jgi:hypothetical protein